MGKASRQKADRRKRDSVKVNQLRYDLRAVCDDCPFRSDAKYHSGIFGDLKDAFEKAKEGLLSHTCHKTDERAECDDVKRAPRGSPIQHCAGLLMMAKKNHSLLQWHMVAAKLAGKLDFDRIVDAQVFRSFEAMLAHYLRGVSEEPWCSISQRREIDVTITALERVMA